MDGYITEIAAFKQAVYQQLEKKFRLSAPDPSGILSIAAFLDPRFKSLKFLPENVRAEVRAAVAALLSQPATPQQPAQDTSGACLSSDEETPPTKRPCLSAWDIIGVDFGEEDATPLEKIEESPEEELQRYTIATPPSRNTSPLEWWKLHGTLVPRLATLAKKVLCTPSTSTPAERVFSAGGLIASQQRAALSPENVDALIFLNKNMALLFGMKPLHSVQSTIKQEPGSSHHDAVAATEQVTDEGHPPLPAVSLSDSWEDV